MKYITLHLTNAQLNALVRCFGNQVDIVATPFEIRLLTKLQRARQIQEKLAKSQD